MKLFVALTMIASGVACTTDDPRGDIRQQFFRSDEPRQLGELCGGGFGACAPGTNLVCYDGACTPADIAAACNFPNASPCGEDAFCIARGNTDGTNLTTICNCSTGDIWDSMTCITDPRAALPASTIGTNTCPLEFVLDANENGQLDSGDVPTENTENCPMGSFCSSNDGGGDCVEPVANVAGSIGGAAIAGVLTGAAVDDVTCARKYLPNDEDGETQGSSGIVVTIGGAAAGALVPGATTIVVESFDRSFDSSFFVWPRTNAPDPQDDSGRVNLDVDGTITEAIGGDWDVVAATGMPPEMGDGRIPNGEGRFFAQFYLGLGGADFLQGTLNIACGDNIADPGMASGM